MKLFKKIIKMIGLTFAFLFVVAFIWGFTVHQIKTARKAKQEKAIAAIEIPAITVGETGRAYYDNNGNAYTPDIHYTTVNYNKYEIPLKSSITHEVLAQGVIKEAYLSALLVKLYQDAMEEKFTDYPSRPKATHVQIIAFDKFGNRLAILNKIGDTNPDTMYFLDSVDQ